MGGPGPGQRAGGEIITHDAIARRAAAKVLDLLDRTAELPPLAGIYGLKSLEISRHLDENPDLAVPLSQDGPTLLGEVDVGVKEGARTLADLMLRRCMLGLAAGHGLDGAERAALRMARLQGWDNERVTGELAAYHEELQALAVPAGT